MPYNVIQCNSAMHVAGPAVLSFGAVIARTSRTNRAGVWIVRPTHAKIFATILSHSLIVRGSTRSTVSNVVRGVDLFIGSIYIAIYSNPL